MPGLLGALVAGGVAGGAEAVNKNVATQNQQTIDENVAAQRAGVEDMYSQAKEMRGYAMAGRYRDQVIRPALEQGVPVELARQGLYDGTPTPEDIAAGRKQAKPADIAAAQSIALTKAGVNPEIAAKSGYDIVSAADKNAAMLEAWTGRGTQAALINAGARNYATDTMSAKDIAIANAKYANMPASQANIALRSANFILLPAAEQAAIQSRAAAAPVSVSAPGALSTGVAPGTPSSAGAPPENVDALFPPK